MTGNGGWELERTKGTKVNKHRVKSTVFNGLYTAVPGKRDRTRTGIIAKRWGERRNKTLKKMFGCW